MTKFLRLTAITIVYALLFGCSDSGTEDRTSSSEPGVDQEKLLIIGQDLGAIRGYMASDCCPRPDGLTAYVDFYDILKEGDFGGLGVDPGGNDSLLLAIMLLFGWRGYHRAMDASDEEITRSAQESNYFAAKAIAGKAAENIQRYFQAIESVSREEAFRNALREVVSEAEPLLAELSDPRKNAEEVPARAQFLKLAAQQVLQKRLDDLMADPSQPAAASWFVCDARGTQLASVFNVKNATSTVGQNYAWRTYYHGGSDDLKQVTEQSDGSQRVSYEKPPSVITKTHLSAPFQSNATNKWKLAISTPVYEDDDSGDPSKLLGIVAFTIDLGIFSKFDEGSESFFAVLVDGRKGQQEGMILQHPLFENKARLPDRFSDYRVPLDEITSLYRDPLVEISRGKCTIASGSWPALPCCWRRAPTAEPSPWTPGSACSCKRTTSWRPSPCTTWVGG